MKTQVARNWRLGRTELQVTPQRGETLDVSGANWLCAQTGELLLPVDYDPEKVHGKKLQLAYDITGLVALKRRLPKVWSQESYYAALEGVERVCAECASGTRLIERILFDVEHVYLAPDGEPRFIYVPLDGVAYDASQNSPLLVLAALASRRLRFDSQAGMVNAEHLRQFVLAKEVFSLNGFRRFLDGEFAGLRQDARRVQLEREAQLEAARSARQVAYMDELFANFGSDTGASDAHEQGGTSAP